MNTLQIQEFMLKNRNTNKIFKGVFASDMLPKQVNIKPALFIVNTDPSHKSGAHWVAFYFGEDKTAEFFDSYGQPPQCVAFKNFLNQNSEKFKCNKKQLQGYFSNVCGHYCMVYGLAKSKKTSLQKFLSNFKSTDYLYNDRLILKMFNSLFKNKIKSKKK